MISAISRCRGFREIASGNLMWFWCVGAIALAVQWAISSIEPFPAPVRGFFYQEPAELALEERIACATKLVRSRAKYISIGIHQAAETEATFRPLGKPKALNPIFNHLLPIKVSARPAAGAIHLLRRAYERTFNSRAPPAMMVL